MGDCRLQREARLGWNTYVFFPRPDPTKSLSSISIGQAGGNGKSYNSEDCDFLVHRRPQQACWAPTVCKVLNLKYVLNSES